MKKLLIAALTALCVTPAVAQEENPNVYGRWDFHADNGMRGTVVINDGFCHYTVSSAFSFTQSRCIAAWRLEPTTLIVTPLNPDMRRNTFTVPDYREQRDPVVVAGDGNDGLTFHMTRFGIGWMTGHLLGAGDHVTVRLAEH